MLRKHLHEGGESHADLNSKFFDAQLLQTRVEKQERNTSKRNISKRNNQINSQNKIKEAFQEYESAPGVSISKKIDIPIKLKKEAASISVTQDENNLPSNSQDHPIVANNNIKYRGIYKKVVDGKIKPQEENPDKDHSFYDQNTIDPSK
jgi:hypothetical protein